MFHFHKSAARSLPKMLSCRYGGASSKRNEMFYSTSSHSSSSRPFVGFTTAFLAAAAAAATTANFEFQSERRAQMKAKKTNEVVPNSTNPSPASKENEEENTHPMFLARHNSMRKQKRYYPYVVVGAGTTAHAAIEAIRQDEPTADILVLSDEAALPRVDAAGEEDPISEELMDSFNEWRRHITSRLENEPDAYSTSPITLLLGKRDMHFDVERNRILLGDGTEVRYGQCLIASAGQPRNFYVLDSKKISYALKDRINTCCTLQDFEQLQLLSKRDDILNVTIVGGGFLGTEIATTLANGSRKIQQVFVESNPMDRYLPEYLALDIRDRLSGLGVEVVSDKLVTGIKSSSNSSTSVESLKKFNTGGKIRHRAQAEEEQREEISKEDESLVVSLLGETKQKLNTDYVVLCSTHIDPNVRIAKESCLEIDASNGGIVVNAQLEAVSDLFVAGNAASYYDHAVGRRRVDRYDHAVNSGLVAGQNMVANMKQKASAGSQSSAFHPRLYTHQPMFRSNLQAIDVLLEGVGVIDANLTTVGIWLRNPKTEKAKERGIVYYLRAGHIVGILLWNASDLLESARHVLQFPSEGIMPSDLKKAISLGPDEWIEEIVCEKK